MTEAKIENNDTYYIVEKMPLENEELNNFIKFFKLEGKKFYRPSILVYSNGDVYKGEINILKNKKYKRHGLGTVYYNSGDTFAARWKNDKANGCGYYVFKNGTEYIGKWLNNKFHWDKNKIRESSGTHYVGETILGKISGRGKMCYANGDVYSGDWVDGNWHNQGSIQYADGDSYVGQFNNDAKHGTGTYRWANGIVYTGNWYKDDIHGNGVVDATTTTGLIYEGPWCLGQQLDNTNV